MNTIFFIFLTLAGLLILIFRNRLATQLQESFIRQSKQQDISGYDWSSNHAKTLMKALVIFFGVLLVVSAYPLAYGAIAL